VAPKRTLTTAPHPKAVALDLTRDLLWVTSYPAADGSSSDTYSFPRGFTSGTALKHGFGGNYQYLAVDAAHDRLFFLGGLQNSDDIVEVWKGADVFPASSPDYMSDLG